MQVNDTVMVTTLNHARYRGVVRFVGATQFATGVWYGVELDNADGRNNGSVQGVRYFSCPTRHGVFATASKLEKYFKFFFVFSLDNSMNYDLFD